MNIEREAPMQNSSNQQVCDIISLRGRPEEERPKLKSSVGSKRIRIMDAQARSEYAYYQERKGLLCRLETCAIVNSNLSSSRSSSCTMHNLMNATTRGQQQQQQVANKCRPTMRITTTTSRTQLTSSTITRIRNKTTNIRRTHIANNNNNNKILLAFSLLSCILLCGQAVAGSGDSPAQPTSGAASSPQDSKAAANSNDRSDASPSVNGKSSSSSSSSVASQSPSSQTSSIAASLSSAVASAAVAAAVAAAQSSLSGGDARSSTSGGAHSPTGRHSSHAQRSPSSSSSSSGIHLAFKLADAIPEVPYNILHNMVKLDHAAPFYNVHPSKMHGATKESIQAGLIGLRPLVSSPARASIGVEQLANLFRMPLWKRLADGYGEFTSEFRSLFRPSHVHGAHPMKGSTTSTSTGIGIGGTSKLLRDISVPALLVLLASTIPGDWRPVRTRRKALSLVAPPTGLSSPSHLWPTNTGLGDQHSFKQPSDASLMNMFNYGEHRSEPGSLQMSQNQQPQMEESSLRANWLPAPAGQQPQPQQQQVAPTINGNQNQLEALNSFQQQPQHQPQHSIRRSGELARAMHQQDVEYLRRREDPVKQEEDETLVVGRQAATGGLLGGSLAGASNRIMNRIFDANFNNFAATPILYKSSSTAAVSQPAKATTTKTAIKRDQLSDKQRYTLIGPTDNNDSNYQGEQSRPKATLLLSAMSQAITSMLNHPPQMPESGSSSSAATTTTTAAAQNSFLRRLLHQQQAADQMEQRDLTKLLPETWREVVKRTMTTVQQQANSQWKSIEGQLANWVQDKLMSAANSVGAVAAAAGASTSSSPASSTSTSTPTGSPSSGGGAAPVANILASVGSTAMNILGLSNKSNSSSPSTPTAASSTASVLVSSPSKPKAERPAASSSSSTSKRPLAGMAGLIMNTLTNRSSATPGSPSNAVVDSHDEITQKSSPVASQYPTLSGAQPADSSTGQSAPTVGSLPALSLAGPGTSSLTASTTPGASQSSSSS